MRVTEKGQITIPIRFENDMGFNQMSKWNFSLRLKVFE